MHGYHCSSYLKMSILHYINLGLFVALTNCAVEFTSVGNIDYVQLWYENGVKMNKAMMLARLVYFH